MIDVLYFKVDESNRHDHEAKDMGHFKPSGKKSYAMQYYEVPIDVLEDREKVKVWSDKALAVAIRKPSGSKKKKDL